MSVILYLANDWIISGGDFVEYAVDPLQFLLVLCGNTIIGLVVDLHTSAKLSEKQVQGN
jgi:hypothetical protein